LSKIISIGTAVPQYKHQQEDILHFMQQVYAMNETDKRKLKFLYHQSGMIPVIPWCRITIKIFMNGSSIRIQKILNHSLHLNYA